MEITAGKINEIPPGKMKAVKNGGRAILVANVGGTFFAIGNVCTHMGCSLSDGTLSGDRVECPCHGSTFSLKDGSLVEGPAAEAEPAFAVRTEGDNIMLTVEKRV